MDRLTGARYHRHQDQQTQKTQKTGLVHHDTFLFGPLGPSLTITDYFTDVVFELE